MEPNGRRGTVAAGLTALTGTVLAFTVLASGTVPPSGEGAEDGTTITGPRMASRKAGNEAGHLAGGPSAGKWASGGTTTVAEAGPNAFGRVLNNLEDERWPLMLAGKRVFVHRWQPAGSGPAGLDGLGPLYTADSCASCHFKDGRGQPPDHPAASFPPLVYRLGQPASAGGWRGDPSFGHQLQDRGVGMPGEGRVEVSYRPVAGSYPDGALYQLRRPEPRFEAVSGSLDPETRLSLRLPPTLVGMGLLEAVSEEEILQAADPDDRDGDGISGRPNRVPWQGASLLGRFGWKAGRATLEAQVLGALAEDMGVLPEEIGREPLSHLVGYLRMLAPPARRNLDSPAALRGEHLFQAIGCESCHRSQLTTASADAIPGPPELARQTIRPYTDLLLHDLGEELADGFQEHAASGREWRTSPLWGLGLLSTVNGEMRLLHDGRAQSFEEAILWHSGEAHESRRRFKNLSAADRAALIRFLESL